MGLYFKTINLISPPQGEGSEDLPWASTQPKSHICMYIHIYIYIAYIYICSYIYMYIFFLFLWSLGPKALIYESLDSWGEGLGFRGLGV